MLPDCLMCREDNGKPGCDLLELRMKSGNLNCTNFRPKVMARPNLCNYFLREPKTFMGLTLRAWIGSAIAAIAATALAVVFFRTLHILWPEGY